LAINVFGGELRRSKDDGNNLKDAIFDNQSVKLFCAFCPEIMG